MPEAFIAGVGCDCDDPVFPCFRGADANGFAFGVGGLRCLHGLSAPSGQCHKVVLHEGPKLARNS
eukprot:scaffold51378_cov28-Tisochrysis_lutea.AAC.2